MWGIVLYHLCQRLNHGRNTEMWRFTANHLNMDMNGPGWNVGKVL